MGGKSKTYDITVDLDRLLAYGLTLKQSSTDWPTPTSMSAQYRESRAAIACAQRRADRSMRTSPTMLAVPTARPSWFRRGHDHVGFDPARRGRP